MSGGGDWAKRWKSYVIRRPNRERRYPERECRSNRTGGLDHRYKSTQCHMSDFSRLKNRLLAKAGTAIPIIGRILTSLYHPAEHQGAVPWTPVVKRLGECSVSIVTTAGVHRKDQPPFNMKDKNGDPSPRIIDGAVPVDELMITHDYYDHRDADKDVNIVFPIERLREFAEDGLIKAVAPVHFSFMGHVVGPHIKTLTDTTAPEAAQRLKAEGVDIVLLTPG
jgi:D-proline reductase (dithiol) PrdB